MKRRRSVLATTFVLGLLCFFSVSSAHADRPPVREPLQRPYDSDPEVPNGTYLIGGTSTVKEVDLGGSPAFATSAKSSRASWFTLHVRLFLAHLLARIAGGVVR